MKNANAALLGSLLREVDLKALLSSLGASNIPHLLNQVEHFTNEEAERRDRMVLDYFGPEGFERVISAIVNEIGSWEAGEAPTILDVGSGIGTFTIPIAERVLTIFPKARFYALDLTPIMLTILVRRAPYITPILGIAENITGSVEFAKRYFDLPRAFDTILSTLTLHHCQDIKKVLKSFNKALKEGGKAILLDLCRHPFVEFRHEMGDYHLGFELAEIEEASRLYFDDIKAQRLPGICCSSSGRSAELFIAVMSGRKDVG